MYNYVCKRYENEVLSYSKPMDEFYFDVSHVNDDELVDMVELREDYKAGKYILLNESDEAYRKAHPDASVEDILFRGPDTELQKPDITDKDDQPMTVRQMEHRIQDPTSASDVKNDTLVEETEPAPTSSSDGVLGRVDTSHIEGALNERLEDMRYHLVQKARAVYDEHRMMYIQKHNTEETVKIWFGPDERVALLTRYTLEAKIDRNGAALIWQDDAPIVMTNYQAQLLFEMMILYAGSVDDVYRCHLTDICSMKTEQEMQHYDVTVRYDQPPVFPL